MAIGGLLSGLASGVGNAVSGVASGIGNAVSGAGSALSSTPAQTLRFEKFTPQQQQALQFILQQALGGLSSPDGLTQGFAPIEQRARSQFFQNTIPTLAERFTALSGGALSSPVFRNQLGQAGASLEEGLAAQRAGYGLNQQKMLLSLLGLGLTPQFESAYQPRQAGLLESGVQSLASALPLLALL